MRFDMPKLAARDRYKLLTGVVVPRPIALVTTLDGVGGVNAAPFSFFNAMGADPPLVVLGIGNRNRAEPKDTARYIRAGGEFVVNIVTEDIAEAMNVTSIDFPAGTDELALAGLTGVPSHAVKPPRVGESPVNMECREVQTTEIGRNRIILGEVLCMHVRDDLVDPEKFYVHTRAAARGGADARAGVVRAKTRELFEMPRVTYEEWKARS